MKKLRRKTVAKNCKDCTHAKFDGEWGEVKCLKFQKRVYEPLVRANACSEYEKTTKKAEKGDDSHDID